MKNSFLDILRPAVPILTSMALLMAASCRQKDVEFELEPLAVAVQFDWSHAENAAPEGMTVLFFPADGESKAWRFDINDREGGNVEIFPGDYRVITYNNDLPGVNFIGTNSYDSYSATVRMISDSLASSTGMLYGAHLQDIRIGEGHGFSRHVSLAPDSLSTVYNISLDSVSGSERIRTATAILKGVASSVCLQLQRNSEETCSVSAPLSISQDNRTMLKAIATGFGNPDIPDPRFFLEILVTTSHGKYSKTVDVTEQVMNSPTPRNVYIHIVGLDIPAADTTDPEGNPDVGISVGVDGWQVIEINYS